MTDIARISPVDGGVHMTWSISTRPPLSARVGTCAVLMNRRDHPDPALCWTGCKATGRGTSLSALGHPSLTRPKSCHLRKI